MFSTFAQNFGKGHFLNFEIVLVDFFHFFTKWKNNMTNKNLQFDMPKNFVLIKDRFTYFFAGMEPDPGIRKGIRIKSMRIHKSV